MSHPMANVPVSNVGYESPQPSLYHHNKDYDQYMLESTSSRTKKTVSISAMKSRMKTRISCPTQFLRNTRLMRNVTTQVPNLCATPPVWTQPQTPLPVLRG